MKRIGLTLIAILFSSAPGIVQAQNLSIAPFAKLQCGYGSFTGYTESNFDLFTAGAVEQSTYRIFGGFDYGVCFGGTILKSGNDIYRESFFDFFLVHKRISGPSNVVGFTGIGVQCRYQFFYGGFLLGMAGNRNELPINIDDNNNDQIFGDLYGATPMFTLGLRAPINSGHTLFLDIPFNLVLPRNRINDIPAGEGTIYEWYSISLGICYYVSLRD